MEGGDSESDDELQGLRRRFGTEGLEWDPKSCSKETLHVWHWLVDADANLKAARHINDKLRRQHDEEKEQLEAYTEHLRGKCEERVRELEDETRGLKEDLEALLAGTQAVGNMLQTQGLHDVAQGSLGEQIAYVLVERSKLIEELEISRKTPASDREKDFMGQLIKVSTDYELAKRSKDEYESQLAGMRDRVELLERASRQLEMDNETLAYKLEGLEEVNLPEQVYGVATMTLGHPVFIAYLCQRVPSHDLILRDVVFNGGSHPVIVVEKIVSL
ncbi:unnamed protein product [Meganyctiphanes norvegica]|uniref:Uncharacterized protein n=1 Tax=Meganyctiphanes norvegica TaxID=48144 RepID=A0AAV2Q727_MEGNR